MASEQTSIAARIAALKLDQVGRQNTGPPPPYQKNAFKPALPEKRPDLHLRQHSTNVPATENHTTTTGTKIGNQPASDRDNAIVTASVSPGQKLNIPNLPPRPARSNAPSLPPRTPSGPSPSLPHRQPSDPPFSISPLQSRASTRRPSAESRTSATSSASMSGRSVRTSRAVSPGQTFEIKAPAFDQSKLPPLPPKKVKNVPEPDRAPSRSAPASPGTVQPNTQRPNQPAKPQLPVRTMPLQEVVTKPAQPERPKRSALSLGFGSTGYQSERAKQSALSLGFNNPGLKLEHPKPSAPAQGPYRPAVEPTFEAPVRSASASALTQGEPLPVTASVSTPPDLTRLLASKPKPNGVSTTTHTPLPTTAQPQLRGQKQASCLKCRDFSAVDAHAARLSLEAIPSTDLAWLAHHLTSPFPSTTDKARAIFTWMHHNISYNTVAFFSGTVRPSTPASTLSTGLAVCEGYAGLFTALASHCGLESIVVGGHGKGFGYVQSASIPPCNPTGHAWNAVKLDDGNWKLIDCCWGAGVVNGSNQPYKKLFSPQHFTRDNTDFGLSHFPSNPAHFFREDGRATISWQEYMLGPSGGREPPQMFGGFTGEEGIAVESFLPAVKALSVSDATPVIRFQFSKVCAHWDNERDGKGRHYLYVLFVGGVDGREERTLPFESNGFSWWVDVAPRELGKPGSQVKIAAVNGFDGGDGRGLSFREFTQKVGRVAMSFGFVGLWQVES